MRKFVNNFMYKCLIRFLCGVKSYVTCFGATMYNLYICRFLSKVTCVLCVGLRSSQVFTFLH